MGNCQAAEAAAVVIQHPGGKVERLYGAATAAEVMRSNPGHYVALVVLRVSRPGSGAGAGGGAKPDPAGAKITKVKLLKPKDTLLLGQVYRLITSQGTGPSPHHQRTVLGHRRSVSRFDLDSSESEPTELIPSFPCPPAARARRGGAGDPGAAAGQDAAVRGAGRRRPPAPAAAAAATGRRRRLRSRAGAVRRRHGTEAAAAPERRRRRERAALAAVVAEHLRVGELRRRDATLLMLRRRHRSTSSSSSRRSIERKGKAREVAVHWVRGRGAGLAWTGSERSHGHGRRQRICWCWLPVPVWFVDCRPHTPTLRVAMEWNSEVLLAPIRHVAV